MTEMHYLTIGLSIILLAFLLWKEINRPNKGRRSLRILASVLAIAGLLCMILPLHYNSKSEGSKDSAILLTPGFDDDSVQAFFKIAGTRPLVYVSSNTLISARKYNPQLLPDGSSIGKTVHVFGEGVPAEIARSFEPHSIIFHPSSINGITAIHWNTQLKAGEKLSLSGNYNNILGKPVVITISSFSTTLDSLTVPAHTSRYFSLSFVPKQLGRLVCRLSVTNKKDTLEQAPVPFEVLETKPPAVFLLSAAPDFEDKFLRNWLAEKGYPVVTRTGVSKNKYSQEYLNTASINTSQVTGSLLDQADIIVADAKSIAALSANERGILQQYISQKEKGLVIRTDSTHPGFQSALFPLIPGDSTHQQTTRLYLSDTSIQLAPLNLSNTPTLRLREGSRALLSANNKIYAASTLYGAGKIAATTLGNSFSWALAGDKESYDHVWSALFNEVIARDVATESWNIGTALPAINQPATIVLESNQAPIPQAQINGSVVALNQNIHFPSQWTGTYWPAKAGWQTGIGLDGRPWYWYAYNDNEWKNARMAARQAEMLGEIFNIESAAAETPNVQTNPRLQTTDYRLTPAPLPKFWFFLLFLLSISFLWFENKYYNR